MRVCPLCRCGYRHFPDCPTVIEKRGRSQEPLTPMQKTDLWMDEICRRLKVGRKEGLFALKRHSKQSERAAMREICQGLRDRKWSTLKIAERVGRDHSTILDYLAK